MSTLGTQGSTVRRLSLPFVILTIIPCAAYP